MRAHDWRSPLLLGLVLSGCVSGAPAQVRPGIEVLLDDSLHLVRDRRVGLLTNQTGVDARGVDDLTRLLAAGVHLTAIFTPEHGFRGDLDEENIGHARDSATGLPIFSLYGTARAPTAEMLATVDVLLADLQDIGARPYTYVSTILYTLRAAADHGVPVIVLDRPNPLGGTAVQGPVLDTAFASFVGMLPVPLRHGLTMGELALLARAALDLGGTLIVMPVGGWRRSQWFDATGLPWVRSSPNMPSLESAVPYPGTVLFEATNLTVGRGTPIAFQVIGAPWLDPPAVIRRVGTVAGAVLEDTVIVPERPTDGKYAGLAVPAVRIRVRDRDRYDPVGVAVRLMAAVRAAHADSLRLDPRMDQLAGTDGLRRVMTDGADPGPLLAAWDTAAARFRRARTPYLLYPPELP
ncbi:MAG TPA: DUF1343 domain-containing protein [Gemmatimonadales bacterium]|jgi:uncharacterized protein YbbC (DUF1343 family)